MGITELHSIQRFSYYTKQSEKFDRIYEEIITELQKMEQESYMLHSFEIDTTRNLYKGKNIGNCLRKV